MLDNETHKIEISNYYEDVVRYAEGEGDETRDLSETGADTETRQGQSSNDQTQPHHNIKVVVRLKPLIYGDATGGGDVGTDTSDVSVQWDITNGRLTFPTIEKSFIFDQVLGPDAKQKLTYKHVCKHLIPGFFAGYNCSILAYGQTGSGKTFTMGTAAATENNKDNSLDNLGIVPRALKEIFCLAESRESEWQSAINCSFIELYNEEIRDLLDPQSLGFGTSAGLNPTSVGGSPLMSRRGSAVACLMNSHHQMASSSLSPLGVVFGGKQIRIVQQSGSNANEIQLLGVTQMEVSNAEDALECLSRGSLYRSTGSNKMNLTSSRSHAILTLTLTQRQLQQPGNTSPTNFIRSKFHFVDLAGSERVKKTLAQGSRLREGISINSGLLALSNVINALSDPKLINNKLNTNTHVPYRDSKLTRLLQDSLGGNSRTVMVACISICSTNFAETYSTIKYASRARRIKNEPIINKDPQTAMIENLTKRIHELSQQCLAYKQAFPRFTISESVDKLINQATKPPLETISSPKVDQQVRVKKVEEEIYREKAIRINAEAKCSRLIERIRQYSKERDLPIREVLGSENEFADEDGPEDDVVGNLTKIDELEMTVKMLRDEIAVLQHTVESQRDAILAQMRIENERQNDKEEFIRCLYGNGGDTATGVVVREALINNLKERFENVLKEFGTKDGDIVEKLANADEQLYSFVCENMSAWMKRVSRTQEASRKEDEEDIVKDEELLADVGRPLTYFDHAKSNHITKHIQTTDCLLNQAQIETIHWERAFGALENQIAVLNQQLDSAGEQKTELEKRLKDVLESGVASSKASGSLDKNNDASSALAEQLRRGLTKQMEKVKGHQQRLADLDQELQRVEMKRREGHTKIEQLTSELQKLKAEKIAIQKRITDQEKRNRQVLAEKDREICRLVGQTKKVDDDMTRVMAQNEKKIETLTRRNEELMRQINRLQQRPAPVSSTTNGSSMGSKAKLMMKRSGALSSGNLDMSHQEERVKGGDGTYIMKSTMVGEGKSVDGGMVDEWVTMLRDLGNLRRNEESQRLKLQRLSETLENQKLEKEKTRASILMMERDMATMSPDDKKYQSLSHQLIQSQDYLDSIINHELATKKALESHQKTLDSFSQNAEQSGLSKSIQMQLSKQLKTAPLAIIDGLVDLLADNESQNQKLKSELNALNTKLNDKETMILNLEQQKQMLLTDFEKRKIEMQLEFNRDKIQFMDAVLSAGGSSTSSRRFHNAGRRTTVGPSMNASVHGWLLHPDNSETLEDEETGLRRKIQNDGEMRRLDLKTDRTRRASMSSLFMSPRNLNKSSPKSPPVSPRVPRSPQTHNVADHLTMTHSQSATTTSRGNLLEPSSPKITGSSNTNSSRSPTKRPITAVTSHFSTLGTDTRRSQPIMSPRAANNVLTARKDKMHASTTGTASPKSFRTPTGGVASSSDVRQMLITQEKELIAKLTQIEEEEERKHHDLKQPQSQSELQNAFWPDIHASHLRTRSSADYNNLRTTTTRTQPPTTLVDLAKGPVKSKLSSPRGTTASPTLRDSESQIQLLPIISDKQHPSRPPSARLKQNKSFVKKKTIRKNSSTRPPSNNSSALRSTVSSETSQRTSTSLETGASRPAGQDEDGEISNSTFAGGKSGESFYPMPKRKQRQEPSTKGVQQQGSNGDSVKVLCEIPNLEVSAIMSIDGAKYLTSISSASSISPGSLCVIDSKQSTISEVPNIMNVSSVIPIDKSGTFFGCIASSESIAIINAKNMQVICRWIYSPQVQVMQIVSNLNHDTIFALGGDASIKAFNVRISDNEPQVSVSPICRIPMGHQLNSLGYLSLIESSDLSNSAARLNGLAAFSFYDGNFRVWKDGWHTLTTKIATSQNAGKAIMQTSDIGAISYGEDIRSWAALGLPGETKPICVCISISRSNGCSLDLMEIIVLERLDPPTFDSITSMKICKNILVTGHGCGRLRSYRVKGCDVPVIEEFYIDGVSQDWRLTPMIDNSVIDVDISDDHTIRLTFRKIIVSASLNVSSLSCRGS